MSLYFFLYIKIPLFWSLVYKVVIILVYIVL